MVGHKWSVSNIIMVLEKHSMNGLTNTLCSLSFVSVIWELHPSPSRQARHLLVQASDFFNPLVLLKCFNISNMGSAYFAYRFFYLHILHILHIILHILHIGDHKVQIWKSCIFCILFLHILHIMLHIMLHILHIFFFLHIMHIMDTIICILHI